MTQKQPKYMVNRLAAESSPYLQQHKNNPVDWYPWGEKAKEKAKNEEKPLFISIGYSTCHWCHVMARESFEDDQTASFMNENFVNIKIDREEYPGIDKAYQEMFQMIHQRGGGWPLSVWAHPDGTPFYIGTYFPDESKYNMPSFMDVNSKIQEAWATNRSMLDQQSQRLAQALQSMGKHLSLAKEDLTEDLYYKTIIALQQRFDKSHGGIGSAPKFPRVSSLLLLLREGVEKELSELVEFVSFTFHKMSRGGIYDQLGGGFARYSVDQEWVVPHFEKMLYDNAGLIHLGAELFAITGDKFVKEIVIDTIDWLAREMRDDAGGFYSALNAESGGREGKFYVWHTEELEEVLDEELFELAVSRYGITPSGNFEDPHHPEIKGMNVLTLDKSINELSDRLHLPPEEIESKLKRIQSILLDVREQREAPSTDIKILVSWNALAIKGLIRAAELISHEQAGNLALSALDFLLDHLVEEEQVLRRYTKSEKGEIDSNIPGILDDYSFLCSALLDAYEYTGQTHYLTKAKEILELALSNFSEDDGVMFYLNSKGSDDLFNSVVQISDDSMASGISYMVSNLYRIGKYFDVSEYINRGEELVTKLAPQIRQNPLALNNTMIEATPYLRYPLEIVIVNDDQRFDEVLHSSFIPNRLIFRYDPESEWMADLEIFQERLDQEDPTVFVCKGQTCSLPITNSDTLQEELKI